jgi:hypothetical protein
MHSGKSTVTFSGGITGYLFLRVSNSCLPSVCEYAGVLDFQPAVPVVLVNPQLSFRHDPFQIVITNLLEESLAGAFDVLSVDKPLAVA